MIVVSKGIQVDVNFVDLDEVSFKGDDGELVEYTTIRLKSIETGNEFAFNTKDQNIIDYFKEFIDEDGNITVEHEDMLNNTIEIDLLFDDYPRNVSNKLLRYSVVDVHSI